MLKKLLFLLLAVSFGLSQAVFFAPRLSAAANEEMLELATALPESDIVLAMDFDRTLNVAGANILGNDAQKLQHLKDLMKTIENHAGFNPYEVKQVALGVKLPAGEMKDSFQDFEFAAIVRTTFPNGSMLDVWSKRMDAIFAFEEEKAPTRIIMEDFRSFRDKKFLKATPEKIAESVKNLEAALNKTQAFGAQVNAMPKTSVTPAALNNFKKQHQALTATINKYLAILKADSDTNNLRSETIKLLNRWNALALDDPQKSAKLAAIKKESEAIHPAYQKKFEARKKIEQLFLRMETETFITEADKAATWTVSFNRDLDKIGASLKNLSGVKLKKTAQLNAVAQSLASLNRVWDVNLETEPETDEPALNTFEVREIVTTGAKGFYEMMKQAQREQSVNGKRMVVIDMTKLNPKPKPAENKDTAGTPEKTVKNEETLNLAVGFLDANRMVIGLEKTVTTVLKQDANYKNQKAAEMLNNGKNALLSFAVNSKLVNRISEEVSKTGLNPTPSLMDNFFKDINLYGSINFDSENNVTNDIMMSVGFSRQNIETIPMPSANNDEADKTFDIGGYQIGKALFFDLFNSFKAMQASVTFKFEKKKIASLIKSVPRIMDNIAANKTKTTKPKSSSVSKKNPRRINSIQDLLTSPQIYVDMAKLFGNGLG